MSRSSIEWTESTWNPLTGCTKISPGCKNCYAERMARRLQAMGHPNYRRGFELNLHEHVLAAPLSWKSPQIIYVNSMSDMFHKNVPVEFIRRAFQTMRLASRHQFQILTKRAGRLLQLDGTIDWPENVWMGVSIESARYADRADCLRRTGARIKFLSLEPLLGPLGDLALSGIDWVIVGGESGPGARPIEREWVAEVRDRCLREGVPFFFKQWGGTNKKRTGRLLDGRTWDQMPCPVGQALTRTA